MKKITTSIVALFCIWTIATQAQPHQGPPARMTPEMREKVESLKVAFFTRKLDLTSDEATTFWPVYNQFQDELHKIRENRREETKALRDDTGTLSDKEYEKLFDSEVTFRQAEVDVMKKYQAQLKQTLPMKKLARLHRLEDEFKRELLNMAREKRQGNMNGSRPGRK